MKKLLVFIDDEYHTDVHHQIIASVEEAKKTIVEYFGDTNYKICVEENEDGERIVLTSSDNPNEYIVGQTFLIDDNDNYVAVKHHAYDGVDFEVISSDMMYGNVLVERNIECMKMLKSQTLYAEGDEDYASNQVVYDNGNEWIVMTLITLEDAT